MTRVHELRIAIEEPRGFCTLDGYSESEPKESLFSIQVKRGGDIGLARKLFPGLSVALPAQSVEKLTIGNPESAYFMSNALASFPAVTELLIEDCRRKSAIMQLAGNTLCPVLQRLRIHDSLIREKTLLRIVESRTKDLVRGTSSLQRLDIRGCEEISWRVFYKLKPLLIGVHLDGDDGESFESDSGSDSDPEGSDPDEW